MIPACSATIAPRPAAATILRSSGRGTGSPRSTIRRRPSAPIVSASPRNQIQRTTCSLRRRAAGAVRVLDRRRRDTRRRTSRRRRRRASRPRSPASARCRRRASGAARSRRRPCPSPRAGPAKFLPTPFSTRTEPGSTVTCWSKCRRITDGPCCELRAERRRRRPQRRVRRRGRRERERDESDEREASHRCCCPASGERWPKTGATSRSEKSCIETTTITAANAACSAAERGRNASASGASAADDERPADQMVEERRPREEPRVLLVHDERRPGDDERERPRQPPERRGEPAVDEPELRGAGEHQPVGPRAVRVHVDRRVGEERHHRPQQHAEREREPRPEVLPPPAHAPDLAARDRLARAGTARRRGSATAKSQWTISAWGCTVPLQVGEQRPRDDEREDDARGDDEQRRLDRRATRSPARAGAAA